MTKDEALKLALEALVAHADIGIKSDKAITAIKEALAQRTWVGLTDEEIDKGLVRTNYAMQTAGAWRDGVEWAESTLKEKNF